MARPEGDLAGTPRFETVLGRRAWHEWRGIAGLATGVALWVFLATGVVIPLGDALAHLEAPPGSGPVACQPAAGAVAAANGAPCACDCPAPSQPLRARSG